ncbi:MAG: enoyl-CoA hydratase-related protein [Myxococcota bacterium]
MIDLTPKTLSLSHEGGVLTIRLSRPERRNAMSFQMVDELVAIFDRVGDQRDVRAIVLRGAGGHFCSGGDIRDMARARQAPPVDGVDALAVANRRFGTMLQQVEAAGQPVIAVCEGAVMGGGFGLACVADVTVVVEGARFRLPETSLGITPAQVMPFIVRRIGLTQARRLAVTGETLSAQQAADVGIGHLYLESPDALFDTLSPILERIRRCAPDAVAATKRLALAVGTAPLDELLDEAARDFAVRARGEEAAAGMAAFLQKTSPPWVTG